MEQEKSAQCTVHRKSIQATSVFLLLLPIAYCLLPPPAYAQVPIGQKFGAPLWEITQVGSLVSTVVSNAYILAGILFLVLFIWGGLNVIGSAGSSDPQQAAKGWKIITAAGVGFLIIFASYWIIKIIGVVTGLRIL